MDKQKSRKKGKNLNRARNMDIDMWRARQISERTWAVFRERDERFALAHRDDTDEELLTYVRRLSDKLGRMPRQVETDGGEFIATRFGGWERVARLIGRRPVATHNDSECLFFKKERERQAALFSTERRALRGRSIAKSKEPLAEKNSARNRAAEKAAQRRIQQHALHEANIAWWSEHQNDTDEELLTHVKRESVGLRHLPKTTEVLGADYIANRFGGWRLTLFLAGVPMPDNAALPTQAEIDEARRRMDARRAERENGKNT